ncbi:MAG: alanine racemase [Cyclobacteriaceae bacterium]|nr:alanine racemase [Cyclobacteriaceae bacterium]
MLISKSALLANIATYRALLEKKTKLLLMVKANGYGSDALMVAKATENKVDYLGVAFPSIGYKLREKGIAVPIFVMASTPEELGKLAKEKLEPVLYSLAMVKSAVALNTEIKVHIEIDAGMKRLGLLTEDLPETISLLNQSKITVVSVFAHLVAPADPRHDAYTNEQASYFNSAFNILFNGLEDKPFKQLIPTGGVTRFQQYQYDMVRIGIGIYGYDSADQLNNRLKTVSTFQCKILQIIEVKKGETIGYGRSGDLPNGGKIATLSVGYGDGYLRVFGNGNAEVFVNGKRAKTIGTICMDLIMVDVTNIDCEPGDIVELFGSNIGIKELATKTNTIPYEILTNISSRVERVMVD